VSAPSTASSAAPETDVAPVTEELVADDAPWVTVVWNDPVNLMSYVTLIFMKLLGHSRSVAEQLMLDVHHKGRAAVASGSRDQMEADVAKLQGAGLWATLQRDSQ
jgi:ATP-dependent Clp protease adaptor protein ClpS